MQNRYSTYYNGEYTEVFPVEDCVRAILCRNKDNEDTIKRLQAENEKLKSNRWKDEELLKMKAQLDEAMAACQRGFPISESECERIKEWYNKHDVEAHGLNTFDKRLQANGCIGGRYTYHFVPTAIGVSGTIRCEKCGAEFEFCEL